MTRRQCFALVGLAQKTERAVTGRIVDDSHRMGHKLRDRARFDPPASTRRVPVVIVGGGIAGLSAGRYLKQRGFGDFTILEMESQAGGNSRWGENDASAYPWAAHYLPVPNRSAKLVRELCHELGLVDSSGWNERHLCHSPKERLHLHGRWQEGLEPDSGLTAEDRRQFREFHDRMEEFASSGRFTIPAGPAGADLDRLDMAAWLDRHKLGSAYLRWHVDYACRDDYGSLAKDTSAWAAIHYFASREHEEKGPLTWPEGNGWLVKQLLVGLAAQVVTGAMVTSITRAGRRWLVAAGATSYLADAVIFAAPAHLARYLCETPPDTSGLVYSPWLTANLTLDRWPAEKESEPAWDNVIYGSPSLGYVVATHQTLRTRVERTVWTYYLALAHLAPQPARALLLEKDWAYWKEYILSDLERAHPDIRQCVTNIDVMRFGHAMARPVPGWLTSANRGRLAEPAPGALLWAHSDVSGFSIFEEAQYRGVIAAERCLRGL